MEQHKGKSRIELIIESLAERVYCQHELIHNHNKSIFLLIFFISESIGFCFLIFNRKINFIDAHSWMKNPVFFFFEIIFWILYSLFNTCSYSWKRCEFKKCSHRNEFCFIIIIFASKIWFVFCFDSVKLF